MLPCRHFTFRFCHSRKDALIDLLFPAGIGEAREVFEGIMEDIEPHKEGIERLKWASKGSGMALTGLDRALEEGIERLRIRSWLVAAA